MSYELTVVCISSGQTLKSGEILLFLNDQVWEATLDLLALILGKIDPENTTLLQYSLSEFYGCQLADLEEVRA